MHSMKCVMCVSQNAQHLARGAQSTKRNVHCTQCTVCSSVQCAKCNMHSAWYEECTVQRANCTVLRKPLPHQVGPIFST